MSIFRATLARDDASGSGALSILRISDLGGLNQTFGYPKVDAMLTDLGDAVRWLININGGWTAARLNGSDFMILAPALKQRSKLYADADGYFEVIPANRLKQSIVDGQGNTPAAKPSLHIQVLPNDQSSIAESVSLTQHPDMGEVIYAGQGLFIYSSEIGVEGETEFSFSLRIDGEVVERSIRVTMASINDPLSVARDLQSQIRDVFKRHGMLEATQLPTAAIYFDPGDPLGALMTALDQQIIASEAEALSGIKIAYMGDMTAELSRELLADWGSVFETAFAEKSFELDLSEVTGMDGSLLHYEANVRLRQGGSVFQGGEFLPWITRLNMNEQLDREMVQLALDEIEAKGKPIAVKLSAEVIREPAFAAWFEEALSRRGHQHPLLSLQLLEPMAFRYLESFTGLCALARRYGIPTGIEHMGHQMEDIGRLFDVGINFMKIDDFFVTDVDKDVGNQNLLRTLTTLAHSIGVLAIAQGISTKEEIAMIEKLGLDGVSGPGISDRN
jgi:EAL domain-containing protein (putative c-di-GMP-specific phosphodiesterase class I)/GGDEF domain-containing protein